MMFQKVLGGVFVPVVLAIAVLGCTGPTGPAGPAGASAEAGAAGTAGMSGPMGAQGPPGTGGVGGDSGVVLPVGCLSPCHGFNGVITQYQSSVHYSTFITNVGGDEAAAWTTPGSVCGNCHAIDGLALRVAGKVGTVNGGVVQHLGNGQILYRSAPDSGVSIESTYAGGALVAKVDCTTCHAVTNANDPHKTGIPWTDGSFPFVVPSGATDVSYIEKTQPGSATTGTVVPGLLDGGGGSQGPGNACVFCHKSRKDVSTYVTASNKITSLNWGPHEGPQTDVFSGLGGYSYAGKTYGQSTHQLKLQCIDCHMPPVADNSNVPDHSFAPRLSACIGCHATATNFDVNGGQSLVRASLNELRTVLNSAGALTQTAAAPYLPLPASVLADPAADFTLDKANPNGAADGGATVLTADQAGALYNYFLIARGGALGVHNTKYTQQLVYDSIVAMGASPVAIAIRPQ